VSERIGIHLSTGEWLETDVEHDWATARETVSDSFQTGDPLEFGGELFNSFHVVSVRRGGIPVDPEQTT
jgi:hypothetical protein